MARRADRPDAKSDREPEGRGPDLAAEAERGRTARTPFLALAGVWLAVVAVVAVVLALALIAYFVWK